MAGLTDTIQRLLEPVMNRLRLLVGKLVIVTVNDSGEIQRVQVTGLKDEVHDGVPRLMHYGVHSVPPAGTFAVALFAGGNRENGTVIGDVHQASKPKGWLGGESGLYDDLGKFIRLRRDGTLEINAPRILLKGTRIEAEATEDLRLWAGVSYRLDVAGYAEQLEHVGGTEWRRRNWTIGATFLAAINNPIEPPQVDDE